jgi:hypothetical protein
MKLFLKLKTPAAPFNGRLIIMHCMLLSHEQYIKYQYIIDYFCICYTLHTLQIQAVCCVGRLVP